MLTPAVSASAVSETCATVPRATMVRSCSHPAKALLPMLCTLAGKMSSGSAVLAKARSPIVRRPLPSAMLARLVHPSKADAPMETVPPGIWMLPSAVQPAKAESPMEVMVLGSVSPVSSVWSLKAPSSMAVTV